MNIYSQLSGGEIALIVICILIFLALLILLALAVYLGKCCFKTNYRKARKKKREEAKRHMAQIHSRQNTVRHITIA